MTLKSLRAQMIFVPGELVRTQNKPVLKFPSNYWYRDVIEYALERIEEINYEIFTQDSGLILIIFTFFYIL